MTLYYLSSQIHYCYLDGVVVLMDLRTARYKSLSPECSEAFEIALGLRAAASLAPSALQRGLQELLEAGIITTFAADGRPATPPSLEASDSLLATAPAWSRPKIRACEIASFVVALATSAYNLKHRPLVTQIQQLRHRKSQLSRVTSSRETELVRDLFTSFRWQRLFAYTARNACLFDSLVLTDFLTRRGIDATFAIGVQSKPFSAHAWVQHGTLVLNETVEKVKRYTAILAV